jgi:hypothetical protein
MKAFPTAIPAVTKSSIVALCASGNANMRHDSSARPVMAILLPSKILQQRSDQCALDDCTNDANASEDITIRASVISEAIFRKDREKGRQNRKSGIMKKYAAMRGKITGPKPCLNKVTKVSRSSRESSSTGRLSGRIKKINTALTAASPPAK